MFHGFGAMGKIAEEILFFWMDAKSYMWWSVEAFKPGNKD